MKVNIEIKLKNIRYEQNNASKSVSQIRPGKCLRHWRVGAIVARWWGKFGQSEKSKWLPKSASDCRARFFAFSRGKSRPDVRLPVKGPQKRVSRLGFK